MGRIGGSQEEADVVDIECESFGADVGFSVAGTEHDDDMGRRGVG